MSGPLAGHIAVITDVTVTSTQCLAITVRFHNGGECTVGYHAVREYWWVHIFDGYLTSYSCLLFLLLFIYIYSTERLLLDYQPLKPHQQQFNVELPWKEVEVDIQSGCFQGCRGIIKNVRVDFWGCLRLSLWVPSHDCSIDIDHSVVLEKL